MLRSSIIHYEEITENTIVPFSLVYRVPHLLCCMVKVKFNLSHFSLFLFQHETAIPSPITKFFFNALFLFSLDPKLGIGLYISEMDLMAQGRIKMEIKSRSM